MATFLLVFFLFIERPDFPPSPQSERYDALTLKASQSLFGCFHSSWGENNSLVIIVIIVYVVSISATWSVPSLMIQMMNDRGFTQSQNTFAIAIYAACSVPTPLVTGWIMDRFKNYHVVILGILAATTGAFLWFVLSIDGNIINYYFSVGTLAFVTGSYTVSFTECASELAFPLPESDVSSLMFFFAQFSAAAGTAVASSRETNETALWVFFAMYVCMVIVLLIGILVFRPHYGRSKTQLIAEHRTVQLSERVAPDYLKRPKRSDPSKEGDVEDEEDGTDAATQEKQPMIKS